MTHDSIAVGEDGPTHQPIEHLASFRAMPNINVIRPADVIETIEAWQIALQSQDTPTLIALSRQKLPQIRQEFTAANLTAKGAYIISDVSANDQVDITILASGSELNIALDVKQNLAEYKVRVVAVPCFELAYQDGNFMNNNSLKIAIEAGCKYGWQRFISTKDMFFGIDQFGKSAPGDKLLKHFGLEAEKIAQRIRSYLARLG